MESRVKLLGHPLHAMLTDFPAALFTATVLFDVIGLISGDRQFATVSWWALSAGLLFGLAAALFGLIDWLGIRSGTRAKRIGMWHGLGNLVVVILFAASWWLRLGSAGYAPSGVAVLLGIVAIGIALVTLWLGGELVFRLRIGVDDEANADAPSSLSAHDVAPEPTQRGTGRPARIT
jgi:uncharacterized membrane protein